MALICVSTGVKLRRAPQEIRGRVCVWGGSVGVCVYIARGAIVVSKKKGSAGSHPYSRDQKKKTMRPRRVSPSPPPGRRRFLSSQSPSSRLAIALAIGTALGLATALHRSLAASIAGRAAHVADLGAALEQRVRESRRGRGLLRETCPSGFSPSQRVAEGGTGSRVQGVGVHALLGSCERAPRRSSLLHRPPFSFSHNFSLSFHDFCSTLSPNPLPLLFSPPSWSRS